MPCAPPCARPSPHKDSLDELKQLTLITGSHIPWSTHMNQSCVQLFITAFHQLVPHPLSHHHGRYSLVLSPAILEYPPLPLWHVYVQAQPVRFLRRFTACLGGWSPPRVPDPLPAKQMQGPWKLILILNRPAPTKLLPLLTIQHLLVAPVVDHQQSTGSYGPCGWKEWPCASVAKVAVHHHWSLDPNVGIVRPPQPASTTN